MIWFLLIFMTLSLIFMIYINARLFNYILTLEDKVQEQIEKTDNIFQSLKEIVHNDFLLADGRLKKILMPKDRNRIYNGIKVEDQGAEL